MALRKTIRVEQGQLTLKPEVRFHFYITNVDAVDLSAAEVVREANQRCHQENLIEQSKNGFHAMRMPCDTLLANEAHMNVAALAWTLKAWVGLLLPDRSEGELLVRMEFRRFVASMVQVPTRAVRAANRPADPGLLAVGGIAERGARAIADPEAGMTASGRARN